MLSCEDLGEVDILVDDPAGEIGELHVVAAGVVAQVVERGGQLQAAVLGRTPLACSMMTRLLRAS